MASIAEDLATKAKAFRATQGANALAAIQSAINSLGTKANAEAAKGRSYLQLTKAADGAVFDAVQTLQGKKYLKDNGLTVEDMGQVINIWWEAPDTIQKELDAILNPPPVTPTGAI